MPDSCIVCGTRGVPSRIRDMAMLRCSACGFLWLAEKILSDGYYDDVDSGMDPRKNARRRRNMLERIRTFRRSLRFDQTCDMGTGEGMFLHTLRELGYKGCFGIEPSEACVAHARSLGLDVERGTIRDVAALLKGRTVRVFTLFHVIEHLNDPAADIQTLAAHLAPGGHIVIETPNARGFAARKRGEHWDLFYPEHLWYFSDQTLPRFLETCGLRIVAVGKRDFDPSGKGIPELLWRIGVLRKDSSKTSALRHVKGGRGGSGLSPCGDSPRASLLSRLLSPARNILAFLMQWRGNVDHVWAIAQKM